jgi:UDP-2,4-diacetamido-2,4,6-trideoxy-beta-L-altropyranose hydrolase
MNIAFRVDASEQIGTGHVMRCLTLADELKVRGAHATFICREAPGSFEDIIQKRGHTVRVLSDDSGSQENDAIQTIQILSSQKPGCLVVDHYGLDAKWEQQIRTSVSKIMVIDDLANRSHDCDFLLDQNFYFDAEKRYEKLLPPHCKKFLGPRYALLRPQFWEARKHLNPRDGHIHRVLVSFGGSDLTNETAKALKALQKFEDLRVEVVVGINSSHRQNIEKLCMGMKNISPHIGIENMAILMMHSDLAIGACGTTTWERCYLGLPSQVVILAENQKESSEALDKMGVVKNLGWHHEVTEGAFVQAIQAAYDDPAAMRQMSQRALAMMPDYENPLILEIFSCLK